ncbi:nucleoside monophosphate kinase [Ruficoccus amylovorans]|uniref:Adenylate kinase n=1 Tax=Ruficoccus amylovorans TaxID=1804625 RepID=A0A842HGJ1_9BACT|nr:nucleoside monophosphate kinase [Ruficoccus amylovorans]MBC2595138.1 nucleoside monophosphate kinase [Ruficoccus amylovorans]
MTADTPETTAPAAESTAPVRDLEIKDAQIIFNSVWNDLEKELGADNLCFPKEIFWLNGAPGAGKGTHTRTAMQYRDFTESPIVVSDLLKSPDARKRIDAGLLVGDREVTDLVFRALLEPRYKSGAVVDGFPRTKVQVECLKMLYNKLNELRSSHINTLLASRFPKPHFHILVLFIDEDESIKRQLLRGRKAIEHNREVEISGVGRKVEVRKTDLDEDAARNRYRTFKEQTYEALQSLRDVFFYHYINSQGTIEEVRQRIVNELKYQSSLELEEATFDRISTIPLATSIVVHARQELVSRLDSYEQHEPELFGRVVELVREKFMPIIIRHAISGRAIVNSEADVFDHPLASAMLIDIFSERGFYATVDIQREEMPDAVDPKTFKITTRPKRVVRVHIRFPGSEIRRG